VDIFTQGRGGVPKAGLLWWLRDHSRIFLLYGEIANPLKPATPMNWLESSIHLPQFGETWMSRVAASAKHNQTTSTEGFAI
jgi:hypothetical protein